MIKKKAEQLKNRNIIAKKDAIIKKIEEEQGQIIKEICHVFHPGISPFNIYLFIFYFGN